MRPYYTLSDGTYVVIAPGSFDLPVATNIWFAGHIADGTTAAAVQVNNWLPSMGSESGYTFGPNRTNYAQGETFYGDDWMGGGYEGINMYYQPLGSFPNGWSLWGTFSSCVPGDHSTTGAPFDYSEQCNYAGTTYEWTNGGYGNGDFGS